MLDDMILTVSDVERSLAFYEAADNNGKVDEFYRATISAGAVDNISPRARAEYYPGYYAADVFDPDGYSFEVVHKS
jgi:predicted lactoylglutathione lyase